jgi:hypothetical protein
MGVATDLSERFARRQPTADQLAARRRRAELSQPNTGITPEGHVGVWERPQQAPRILEERKERTFD